jgi:hypothetical protein
MKSPDIRQRLLEENFTLEKSFEKARSYELAVKNSERSGSSNPVINAISLLENQNTQDNENPETCAALWSSNNFKQHSNRMPQRNSSNCFYCGYQAHSRESCPARDMLCHNCGIKGHFAKVCRKSKKSGNLNNQDKSVNRYVSALPSSLSDAVVSAKVRYYELNVLVDTGSSESYINSLSVENLDLTVDKIDCHNVRMASLNHESKTLGSTCVGITVTATLQL